MNKAILIGNLTKNPELSHTSGGVAICHFSIAVNRNFTSGDKKETDFFNIIAWRTLAENCSKYLKKGSKVAVIGNLQNRTYEDKNGVNRTVTEISASEIEFLFTKQDNHAPEEDDDLPF